MLLSSLLDLYDFCFFCFDFVLIVHVTCFDLCLVSFDLGFGWFG